MMFQMMSGPHENPQKWPLQTSLLGTLSLTGCSWMPVRSSWQLSPPTMISQWGATAKMLFPTVSAAFLQSVAEPSPQVGVPISDFLTQFLRSIPITRGLSLQRRARSIRHLKKSFQLYCLLYQSPSPSLWEQHHCDTLVWLFKKTMSPSSVSARTVSSKISLAVLPKRSGFLSINFLSMKLLSLNCWSENVSRTQFMPNLQRISLQSYLRGRRSSPPTQCLLACPPDQLPPASFTLLPVASTIFMPQVERGNLMSLTSKSGSSAVNYFCSRKQLHMQSGFLQWFQFPIQISNINAALPYQSVPNKQIDVTLSPPCFPNADQ